jgi:hypothetical protein
VWPFKRKRVIKVECNFPRYGHDDQEFIRKNLYQDLVELFGNCYKIEVYDAKYDNVTVTGCKDGIIKERAIRMYIYQRIRKSK